MIGRRIGIPLAVAVGAVAVGGVAGALIGVPGFSGASTTAVQTQTTQPNQGKGAAGRVCGPKADLDAAAQALKLTPGQLREKLSDGKTTIADIATQQHVPLDDVINAIAAGDRACIEDFVHNPLPVRGSHDKGLGLGRAALGVAGGELDAAAKALNMKPEDLLQQLRSGKSIADLAQQQHVAVNNVINAMVDAANARIDKAKDAGKLSSDQADMLKAKVKDAITAFVNGQGPGHFGFGKFGHIGPGRWGPSGHPTSP